MLDSTIRFSEQRIEEIAQKFNEVEFIVLSDEMFLIDIRNKTNNNI